MAKHRAGDRRIISISLPEDLAKQLDRKVGKGRDDGRSATIAKMIQESLEKLVDGDDWVPPTTDAALNKAMLAVIDTVAADLGNTRTVCRSSYIHPWFLDAWMEQRLGEAWAEVEDMRAVPNLSKGESSTLRLLKKIVAGDAS